MMVSSMGSETFTNRSKIEFWVYMAIFIFYVSAVYHPYIYTLILSYELTYLLTYLLSYYTYLYIYKSAYTPI